MTADLLVVRDAPSNVLLEFLRHAKPPETDTVARRAPRGEHLEDLRLLLGQDLSVVVAIDAVRDHLATVPVQLEHLELAALMQVECAFMTLGEGAHAVDRPDRPLRIGLLD